MKYYTQFLTVQNNELVEILGSDGVFILDGRNNLQTMKCDSLVRSHKLRHVQPNIDGYRIMRGERFDNSTMIYEWVRSGAIDQ